jgi:tyrosinase
MLIWWLFTVFHTITGCVVVRKELRDMSNVEWQNFVTAWKTLKGNGKLGMYIDWHIQAFRTFHWNDKFLPFHRAFLEEFERELIKVGAPFLPFWDWTFESQNVTGSPILSQRYFGQSDGTFVINGPFHRNVYTTSKGGPLIRQYRQNSTLVFYARSLLEQTIMVPDFSEFSRRCEIGPHSIVHTALGGANGQLSRDISPEDPIFWVHHAFIDKLWVKHQETFGYNHPSQDDQIGYPPWQKTVKQVLNSECTDYNEPTDTVGPTGNITAPILNTNWLARNGANTTLIGTLNNNTKSNVNKINKCYTNKKKTEWYEIMLLVTMVL